MFGLECLGLLLGCLLLLCWTHCSRLVSLFFLLCVCLVVVWFWGLVFAGLGNLGGFLFRFGCFVEVVVWRLWIWGFFGSLFCWVGFSLVWCCGWIHFRYVGFFLVAGLLFLFVFWLVGVVVVVREVGCLVFFFWCCLVVSSTPVRVACALCFFCFVLGFLFRM